MRQKKQVKIIAKTPGIKSNANEFKAKASIVHNEKYTYPDYLIYVNAVTKVPIYCPIDVDGVHGIFLQSPGSHLQGIGCPKCKLLTLASYYASNKDEFSKASNNIHGEKYDYSRVIYKNEKTRVDIICPIDDHGLFSQTPNAHLAGCGCPKCGMIINVNKRRKSSSEFIEQANMVHNNKYDYSKFIYVNAKTPGIIICPEHDEFWQSANSHINNKGDCPKCSSHKNEKYVFEYLHNRMKNNIVYQYYMVIDGIGHIFDFYIPFLNLIIEYNGDQHYKPINFRNNTPKNIEASKIAFIDRQARDKIKKQYCENNGIRFLPIDGREIKGRAKIAEFLEKELSSYLDEIKTGKHVIETEGK